MENSLIGRWDERWKLAAFLILTFVTSYVHGLPVLMICALLVYFISLAARLPLREGRKLLKTPFSLLVVMSPFILLTPGMPLREGLALLLTISLKSLTIFLLFAILMNTSGMPRIMHAMKSLGIPEKLILILTSTYRYIFLYREDMRKLLQAARLRGFSLQKGVRHALTSADIMLTLIIRSYEQSQRVSAAMKMRGYSGDYRTVERFHARPGDVLLFSAITAGSGGIILWELLC